MKTMPSENWVKARAQCSAFAAFKKLESGVIEDVAVAKDLGAPQLHFSVDANLHHFRVIRASEQSPASVSFTLLGETIVAKDDVGDVIVSAAVVLRDDGECRLVTDSGELEFWQFRRRALENLFFKR